MCPNKLFSHLKYLNMRKWVFTQLTFFKLNSLSEKNRTSEPLKAGKNLRKPVGPEATSNEAAWSSASIQAGEEGGA